MVQSSDFVSSPASPAAINSVASSPGIFFGRAWLGVAFVCREMKLRFASVVTAYSVLGRPPVIICRSLARLFTRRDAGCDPRPYLALNPTESAIGERHTARELPCTFKTLTLGARKPGDTANLVLAEETFEGNR
jgi:hypothetical protein